MALASHPKDVKLHGKDSPSFPGILSDSSSSVASEGVTESVTSSESVAGATSSSLPPAPDGGWGWFVLLGAFVINIVVGGTSFSFGVMYVHLLKEFQQSKSATAWVASILYCVSLLLGPVASTLTVRFGLRKVTIAAGLVTTAGFLASAFAPSLWVLYLTFGVMVGAGFAVCDVTASVAVAYYFRKRRALATGLSECGTGIGTFAFPPLCEALVDVYGWRGAFVLMGGIALHVTVCGALFRPLDAFDRLAGTAYRLDTPPPGPGQSSDSASLTCCEDGKGITRARSQLALPTFFDVTDGDGKLLEISAGVRQLPRIIAKPRTTLHGYLITRNLAGANRRDTGNMTWREMMSKSFPVVNHSSRRPDSADRIEKRKWQQKFWSERLSLNDIKVMSETGDSSVNESPRRILIKCRPPTANGSSGPSQDYTLLSDKVVSIVEAKGGTEVTSKLSPSEGDGNLGLAPSSRRLSTSLLLDPDVVFRHSTSRPMMASCPELHLRHTDSVIDRTSSQKYSVCLSKAKDLLKAAFDKEILRHSPFLLFTASNFLMYFWGDVPYLFANDFALERGVPDTQASFLISIIGIVNTVGQVIYGLIGDSSCNLTVVFGVSVVASGVVVVLLPFAESYWFMAVLCGLYGFFDAACYALITAILVSYVGLDKLAHAYGLVMMGKGLANLGGPPVAGWLTDETSYTVAFSVGGSIIILSGLILFPSYVVGVCRRRRSGRRDREGGADVVTWQDAGCGKPLVKEIMVGTPNAV